MTPRTLKFQSNDIGVDLNLLLCFVPSSQEVFKTVYPVVWEVVELKGSGLSTSVITYEDNLAFSAPQIEDGRIIDDSTYVPIERGQKTILSCPPGSQKPEFSTPTTDTGSKVSAKNSSGAPIDIGVGLINVDETPRMNTVLLYYNVGNEDVVNAEITPTLSIYIDSHYQQGQLIKDEEVVGGPLWTENLTRLKATTTWIVSRSLTGKLAIRLRD